MKNDIWRALLASLVLFGAGIAQGSVEREVAREGDGPRLSAAAREAFAQAYTLVERCRGLTGPERSHRIEAAASAYDALVARFDDEPRAAAEAAFRAAEQWRRHGSLPLAEKDYLHAADRDLQRYGQRALLGAADMQRRQHRYEAAAETYRRAEKVDPGTSRAQHARLWIARMVQQQGELERAIELFQAALESAPTPRLELDTVDLLAKAWIAKGDLDSAEAVIAHADKIVARNRDGDPVVAERLRRAAERLPARRALRRAIDERDDVGGDAVRLDEHRRKQGDAGGSTGKGK